MSLQYVCVVVKERGGGPKSMHQPLNRHDKFRNIKIKKIRETVLVIFSLLYDNDSVFFFLLFIYKLQNGDH